jgi:hypothetical protein
MDKQPENNILSNFENKLKLCENIFTFQEFTISTKITKDFKLFLPKEITQFILKENNFFSESEENSNSSAVEYFKLDKEKLEKLSFQLNTNNVIDFTENNFIQDIFILKSLLSFFGSINKKNEASKFSHTGGNFSSISLKENQFIENSENYEKYLEMNIEIMFEKFKMKDLQIFVNCLRNHGIYLNPNEKDSHTQNFLYNRIKNFVMQNNKILLSITPSNNFWIKTEKVTIGSFNYDKKINNYNFVFYNWKFIKKFYSRIARHPRCQVGYLNSMIKKNLEQCIDCLQIMIPNFDKNYLMFDQSVHENISQNKSGKPNFVRNLEKIINVCMSKNFEFNETNILVLESEKEKAESIKANKIELNVFSEEFIVFSEEEKKKFEEKIDKVFDYLENLLNECDCDVREYLVKNPMTL